MSINKRCGWSSHFHFRFFILLERIRMDLGKIIRRYVLNIFLYPSCFFLFDLPVLNIGGADAKINLLTDFLT